MKIKLIKFIDDLIKPTRAHYNDAGIDCYAQETITLKALDAYPVKEEVEKERNVLFSTPLLPTDPYSISITATSVLSLAQATPLPFSKAVLASA